MAEITITIDESGNLKMLETTMAEPFKVLGTAVTKRASFVEPYDFWPRVAFITVDLDGYQGKGCGAVQEAFAATLGKSTHSVNKPEYNKVPKKNVCITK